MKFLRPPWGHASREKKPFNRENLVSVTDTNFSLVDVLVVMPAKNMVNQAAKIRLALDYDFPLDLIVRTPAYLEERLQMDDWFVREILSRGKVLYVKGHTGMDAKGRIRLSRRQRDHRHEADAYR